MSETRILSKLTTGSVTAETDITVTNMGAVGSIELGGRRLSLEQARHLHQFLGGVFVAVDHAAAIHQDADR